MGLAKFFAKQLHHPAGVFGSFLMSRFFNAFSGELVRKTIDLLDLRPSDTVMDIGFGGGDSLLKMAPIASSGKIVGLDYSAEMLAAAKARIDREQAGDRVLVVRGDMNRLPFASSVFDKVLTINTIYFWRNPGATLQEFIRVLRPQGHLVPPVNSIWANFAPVISWLTA